MGEVLISCHRDRHQLHGPWSRSSILCLIMMAWVGQIVVVNAFVLPTHQQCCIRPIRSWDLHRWTYLSSSHKMTMKDEEVASQEDLTTKNKEIGTFNLNTALFCGGLAFDAYAEPPSNSSRWERGSKGIQVAFVSQAFTRSLYKGLIEVTPLRCVDLPDEDNTAEGLLTGGGVDAYLLVGVVEGKWKEDIKLLEREKIHNGVLDLNGCAHVGRGTTAWSTITEKKAMKQLEFRKKQEKEADTKKDNKPKKPINAAYHIKSTWTKGGEAVWELDPPFYLYVQDPSTAGIALTVMDDDVVGDGSSIGSAFRKLSSLLPATKEKDAVGMLKNAVMEKLATETTKNLSDLDLAKMMTQEWEGEIPLTSKPRLEDKNSQIAAGAAAGAMLAGPAGAAVGGLVASFYEGKIRGKVKLKLRYIPIPQVQVKRQKYKVRGGLPGVQWGEMYERHIAKQNDVHEHLSGNDLEFCFFINHDETGCSCALYRSLENRMIVVSFRGTCEPKDLITDASLIQEAWVKGEDIEKEDAIKVHSGFRTSLESISRRLKELLLASVAPGEDLSQYDLLVTGHSLGGALSTLFVADIAEYGVDAGRSLPQLEPSEPWWISLTSTFTATGESSIVPPPPRPKSLRMYNFGSPRVGNEAFVQKFESYRGNTLNEAFRLVNGQDVVARLPRTFNTVVFGSIGYEHCGTTALISPSKVKIDGGKEIDLDKETLVSPPLWIEGESNADECPVRDGTPLASPLVTGGLLDELVTSTKTSMDAQDENNASNPLDYASKMLKAADKVAGRLKKASITELASIVGINEKFSSREIGLIKSLVSGEAVSHHMEDEYYQGMGRACGFVAKVGEELREM